MAVTFTGSDFEKFQTTKTRTAAGGYSLTLSFHGSEDKIKAKAAEFDLDESWSYTITHDGPLWSLEVTKSNASANGDDGGPEVATDTWSWNTTIQKLDFFDTAEAKAEAIAWAAAESSPISSYANGIKRAIASDQAIPAEYTGYPIAQAIYIEIATGNSGVDDRRFILTRRYTYSNKYPTRVQMQTGSTIYTPSKLVSQFNVPSVVQAALPIAGTAVTGYTWGWQEQSYSADYKGGFRVEETTSWMFALWPNAFNTISS